MILLNTIKKISIAIGFYKPMRWLSRLVRPSLMREFNSDVELYKSLIPEESLCFDVGANVGKKSEALLKTGAQVVGFEPNPIVLPELYARLGNNKKFTVIEAALGSDASISTLNACKSHGLSSLDNKWAQDVIATYNIPVITLDAAIKKFGLPYFCKIDVEGWELEVINGLYDIIPLISFEFHLTEDDIKKTVSCLTKLSEMSPGFVNITPAESSVFLFEKWMSLDEFIEWFPGDLKEILSGGFYGDIYIKTSK